MKSFLLAFAMLCLPLVALHTESSTSLLAGSYSISFTAMSFTIKSKPDENEVTIPGRLQTKGSQIIIETHDADGKPLKMSGLIEGTKIYLWMNAVQHGGIVTYHMTGKLSTDHSASGEVSIFGSHQKVADGKWSIMMEKR